MIRLILGSRPSTEAVYLYVGGAHLNPRTHSLGIEARNERVLYPIVSGNKESFY